MAVKKAAVSRNYQLDFYKLFFAVCIFVFHSRILSPKGHIARLISNKWGFMAVHFFFIVSGMLMINSFMKRQNSENESSGMQAGKYVLGRIKGIALPYYTAFFLSFIARLIIEIKGNGLPPFKTAGELVIKSIPELLMIQNSGAAPVFINDPTWYISAMLIAMLPMYYILARKPDLYIYVICPISGLVLLGFFYSSGEPAYVHTELTGIFNSGVIRAFCGLSFGGVSYIIAEYLKKHISSRKRQITLTFAELILSSLFLMIWLWKTYNAQYWYPALFLMPLIIGIVFSGKSLISYLFRSRIFKFCGTASLTIYLNHFASYRILQRMPAFESYTYKRKFFLMIAFTIASCIIYTIILFIIKKLIGKTKTAVEK